MQKNVAGQKLIVFAFDSTTNLPKTGDAANITAYVSKDYGSVTVLGDTSATEIDSTNAKGYYFFDLAQAETNADALLFPAKSSTSNIVVIGVPAVVFTTPPSWAVALTSSERDSVADALLDRSGAIESGLTPRLAFRYIAAACAGRLSGGLTGTEIIAGCGVATVRITATTDSSGNRTNTLS